MRCLLRSAILCLSVLALAIQPARARADVADSLYNANHPRLLFDTSEIPGLQAKVTDGGADDDAWNYIRLLADFSFPTWNLQTLLYGDFGLTTMPMLGVATWLSTPLDSVSREKARDLTLYIADNYDVDFDEAGSASRLRALSYGYDMFFHGEADSLRQIVRDEIMQYLQTMTQPPYNVWERRPYLANHSAWVAAALGLSAICLDGEADPSVLSSAMGYADTIIDSLFEYQFDPGGSYKEGGLYVGWTMRQLVYYFDARKRFDGFNYGDDPLVREIEKWVPYELLPEGGARLNNMNDCGLYNWPLSYHHTFFDYAQSEWNSGLSAWIWERVAGTYGVNMGINADKVATVLWHRGLPPEDPNTVLPRSKLWPDRGLYHYRTGWPTGAGSDDVMFSFFSGKFHGGHAQEDQNQFTLYGYGARFAIDHGPGGAKAKQSQAHNIVLVDGKGQHNAGGSIGLDGEISNYLLNGFADYIQGDATKAYTTHSPFNDPGYPFPTSDWSWGYDGGNPVEIARRNVIVIRDGDTAPYFLITDDIDKDGSEHTYEWRLHTSTANVVDIAASPASVVDGDSWLLVHPVGHPLQDLAVSTEPFDNLTQEPDATVLRFAITATRPEFAFLLIPGDETVTRPGLATSYAGWGSATEMQWDSNIRDVVIHNPGRQLVAVYGGSPDRGERRDPEEGASLTMPGRISTDAAIAVLRYHDDVVTDFVAVNATTLTASNICLMRVANGPASAARSGTTIDIDRDDADFVFYGPSVELIDYRGTSLPFTNSNGILTPATPAVGQAVRTPISQVRVHPNPFNPVTRISFSLANPARTRVAIYDVRGRRVASLWDGRLHAGTHEFEWDGTATGGAHVASGVYFVRVDAAGRSHTLKTTLLK